MGRPLVQLHLTFLSSSLPFRMLISGKGAELGPVLLLDTNRKSYMQSPTAQSHLTLGDLVRSKSRSVRLEGLYVLYISLIRLI